MKNIMKFNIFSVTNIIATLLFCGTFITPYLRNHYKEPLLLISICLWLISGLFIVINSKRNIKIYKIYIAIMTWVAYIFLLRGIGFSTTPWGNIIIQPFVFFPIVIAKFYKDYMTKKNAKSLVTGIIIISLINIFDNIRLLIKYPGSSELINYKVGEIYLNYNIGGTIFSFFSLLILLIQLQFFLENKKARNLIAMVLCGFYIILASRATAIIFTAIGMIFVVVGEKYIQSKGYKKIIILNASIISVFLIMLNSSILLKSIANWISNPRLSIRLMSLAEFLNYSSYSYEPTSVMGRFDLYLLSIKTFFGSFRNFLIGVGEHEYLGINYLEVFGVGKHSEFLDLGAEYGIIGVFFITYILVNFYKNMIKTRIKTVTYSTIKIVYLLFIAYSFVNNTFFIEITSIVFLVLPLINYVYSEERKGIRYEDAIKKE